LAKLGYDASFQTLDRKYRDSLTAKVDRGYELIGKTPPGTLTMIFGAAIKAKVGVAEWSKEAKAQIDSNGKRDGKRTTSQSFDAGVVKYTKHSDASDSLTVGVKPVKAKITSKGEGELTVGFDEIGSGSAFYNPKQATFGGGVKLTAKVVDLPGVTLATELSIKAQIQGLSKEDVDRALKGWLVPQPGDVNAKWLQEQQLKARCSR